MLETRQGSGLVLPVYMEFIERLSGGEGLPLRSPVLFTLPDLQLWLVIQHFSIMKVISGQEISDGYLRVLHDELSKSRRHELQHAAVDPRLQDLGGQMRIEPTPDMIHGYDPYGERTLEEKALIVCAPGHGNMSTNDKSDLAGYIRQMGYSPGSIPGRNTLKRLLNHSADILNEKRKMYGDTLLI